MPNSDLKNKMETVSAAIEALALVEDEYLGGQVDKSVFRAAMELRDWRRGTEAKPSATPAPARGVEVACAGGERYIFAAPAVSTFDERRNLVIKNPDTGGRVAMFSCSTWKSVVAHTPEA